MRAFRVAAGVLLLVALAATCATAQQIALSLNLDYNVRTNRNSGGMWTLVGLADSGSFGIALVDVKLTGINSAQPAGPKGVVNSDSDPAGFVLFTSFSPSAGVTEVIAAQSPLDEGELGNGHQNIFYGVGTLSNGAPNYPDQPMSTISVGPELPTLQNVMGVPWGVPGSDFIGESLWDTAVPLAQGEFLPGATPAFSSTQFGGVFMDFGDIDTAGTIVDATIMSAIVRDNFLEGGLGGDYNNDGVVNAADYVLWRNGGPLANEGVTPGAVTPEDYDFWVDNFGITAGAGAHSPAVSAGSVPEPSGVLLTLLGVVGGLIWARIPGFWRGR